jgi:hypothetical protein
MFKTFGVIVAGVFIGAVLTEVLRQAKPHILEAVEGKAGNFFADFKSAFKEGYKGTSTA